MPELNPLASLSEIASSLPRQPASNDSPASSGAIGLASGAPKPRRLSSAGQTRRRHSDATAATLANAVVSRISANAIPTTPPASNHSRSRSTSSQVDESLFSLSLPPASVIEHLKVPPQSIEILKKKGHRTFKCESCGKVYTHASWCVPLIFQLSSVGA
ncbi:hypothetical protein DL93DRAFT_795348 [Clavulina sp. PMI_390]|nr:hypothetical protein DL93DRAFT_795348 [Clavulina sp. PMI_390]